MLIWRVHNTSLWFSKSITQLISCGRWRNHWIESFLQTIKLTRLNLWSIWWLIHIHLLRWWIYFVLIEFTLCNLVFFFRRLKLLWYYHWLLNWLFELLLNLCCLMFSQIWIVDLWILLVICIHLSQTQIEIGTLRLCLQLIIQLLKHFLIIRGWLSLNNRLESSLMNVICQLISLHDLLLLHLINSYRLFIIFNQ